MKTELSFLTDLLNFSREGGATMSDVRSEIMTRIEDLNCGYSQEDAKEIQMIESTQRKMQTVDDYKQIRKLLIPAI